MFSVIDLYLIAGRYNCENNKTRQKIEGLKSEKSEKTEELLHLYKKENLYQYCTFFRITLRVHNDGKSVQFSIYIHKGLSCIFKY